MSDETKKPASGTFAKLMTASRKGKAASERPRSPTPAESAAEPEGTKRTGERTAVRTHVRPYGMLTLPAAPSSEKRRPERYAFQFWADQITRLKRLQIILNMDKNPDERREITLSDMVRAAVDNYINQTAKKHGIEHVRDEEAYARTGVRT